MVNKQGKDPAEEFLAFAANRGKRAPMAGAKFDEGRRQTKPSVVQGSSRVSTASGGASGKEKPRPSSATVTSKKSIAVERKSVASVDNDKVQKTKTMAPGKKRTK